MKCEVYEDQRTERNYIGDVDQLYSDRCVRVRVCVCVCGVITLITSWILPQAFLG